MRADQVDHADDVAPVREPLWLGSLTPVAVVAVVVVLQRARAGSENETGHWVLVVEYRVVVSQPRVDRDGPAVPAGDIAAAVLDVLLAKNDGPSPRLPDRDRPHRDAASQSS